MDSPITEVLSQQYPVLQQMIALLREEQSLLVLPQTDGDALTQLAQAKQQCLTGLNTLEEGRIQLQHNMGLGNSAQDNEQAARQSGCEELWLKVQALTLQAKHLNRLNGILIQQRLQHNQQVLHGLRQLTDTSIYSADGQTRRLPSLQTRA